MCQSYIESATTLSDIIMSRKMHGTLFRASAMYCVGITERSCGNDLQIPYLNVVFGHNKKREEPIDFCKRKSQGMMKTERSKNLAVLM